MNQIEEINKVMLKLQNYAKIPNSIITANEIEMAFRNYNMSQNIAGQSISESERTQIIDILFKKMDEKKCTSSLYYGFQEGWNFFNTNYSKNDENPSFTWKVYIPIKQEYYGFAVKNIISFLCDNGIVSSNKFSSVMRSDSMIVNLTNEDDVTALNQYIDKTPSLKACLGVHQPFIPDWNGIGVLHGYDEQSSYTGRLSKYLERYVNSCKQQNCYDLINANSFLESMRDALNSGRVERPEEIKQIIEHMDVIMNGQDYLRYDVRQTSNRTL